MEGNDQNQLDTASADSQSELNEAESSQQDDWGKVWQIPAAAGSIVLLLVGLWMLTQTRPDNEYDLIMDAVSQKILAEEYKPGMEELSPLEKALPALTPDQRSRFHILRGDLFFLEQQASGGNASANYSQVLIDYHQAEDLGFGLDAEHLFRMTETLIELGEIEQAHKYFARIPLTESSRRHKILKRLVKRNLDLPRMDYNDTYRMLGQLLNEPDLISQDRVWAEAQRAELRLEQGYTDEAINSLLLTMQQLKADGINKFPELYVLLGRGYFEIGEYDLSVTNLEYAQTQLPPADSALGDALLLLGKIAQARREWEDAMALFDLIVSDFPGTRAYLPGLLGRAEIFAQTARYPTSIDDYNLLIGELSRTGEGLITRRDLSNHNITNSLINWHDRLRSQGRLEMGLRFLRLAERLYTADDEMPDSLLYRLAQTHFDIGEDILTKARSLAIAKILSQNGIAEEDTLLSDTSNSTDESGVVSVTSSGTNDSSTQGIPIEYLRLDPATKLQAREHYLASGIYYQHRARLLQISDSEATAQSLQNAARAFDRGGDLNAAVTSLQEFIRLSADHPRQVQGLFMLGRVYQGLLDYSGAMEQFKTILAQHPRSPEAYQSYVPLARCYLNDESNPDPAEAERLLKHVVDGGAGLNPDAPEYADALLELGTLYSRATNAGLPKSPDAYFPDAIRRLSEFITRYPHDVRLGKAQYRLGHAYRQSAQVLEAELREPMPEPDRRRLANRRTSHLESAILNFADSIDVFNTVPIHKQSPLERESLKLSYLWRADCTYDLERYDKSIVLYNEIIDQYHSDFTSLIALVQIVNAFAEKGDFDSAKAAQNRARRRLREMPETAFEDGLLDRSVWERWLNWERIIDPEGEATADAGTG